MSTRPLSGSTLPLPLNHPLPPPLQALQLLEFLLKRGSQQCLGLGTDLLPALRALADFNYTGKAHTSPPRTHTLTPLHTHTLT